MFKRESLPFDSFTKIKITHAESGQYFSVIPDFGGNLNELALLTDSGDLFPVIAGDLDGNSLATSIAYRGAKLSPFPNRIQDGQYAFEGVKYKLSKNNSKERHALHGLVHDQVFKELAFEANDETASICLLLEYSGTSQGYPFPFSLEIEYSLTSEGAFSCTTKVTNNGKWQMPYGDGWHPYFQLEGKIDDWQLKLPKVQRVLLDKRMIPTKKIADDKRFDAFASLKGIELDTCFQFSTEENIYEVFLKHQQLPQSLRIWQDNAYPCIQIYTPEDRSAIAIEPVSCWANSFNNEHGLLVLHVGAVWEGGFGCEVMKS